MKLLKKENWWVWLLLLIFGGGTSNILLGALLDVYNKDSWYANWKNWLLGIICFIIPFFIMIIIFYIQISCLTCAKLNVTGKEIYLSPYIWLLFLIVPIIGWGIFLFMTIYILIWPTVMIYQGEGEKHNY